VLTGGVEALQRGIQGSLHEGGYVGPTAVAAWT